MNLETALQAAQTLQETFDSTKIRLAENVDTLNAPPEGSDLEDIENRDPAVIRQDVAAQISFLRKLKFQYLEQNAKDRYVKVIVSDIDDVPMSTAEDNKKQQQDNEALKENLRKSKIALAEVQHNVRTLAPLVEDDYRKIKQSTERCTLLAKQIVDARLALSRLRQTHGSQRLTASAAERKLEEQVEEMQKVSDNIAQVEADVKDLKDQVKKETIDIEGLRTRRNEVEKSVKEVKHESEDDGRCVPIYNWFTTSLSFYHSLYNIQECRAVSENELSITYRIDRQNAASQNLTIALIFKPNTRALADVQVRGIEEMGVELGDVIEAHMENNDVHGLIAAILARARAGS